MALRSYLTGASRLYRRDGFDSVFHRGLEKVERDVGNALPAIGDTLCRALSVRELRGYQSSEDDLTDVIDTAYDYRGYGAYRSIEPMQIRSELRDFVEAVAASDPETVCEIGTARGGSYYVWAQYLAASNYLSIDLPGGRFGGGHSLRRAEFLRDVCDRPDVDQAFLRGDSHSPATARHVEEILDGDAIDFLFIDGDHTYDGVKDDFERYSPFVADGGLIAFHDIVTIDHDPDCEVDRFWHELREEYETTEIVADPQQDRGGVGLVHW
ncbi:O-methyltransferase-like protein [Halococcus morrhuae DSM 1307]|uniref:O-methyltransferase-like protein n=1 Tax=Halococcus morrhuae DSM 1307 TaxID=931277 RepID=M0MFM6_HALMO|nr:class I SAM-dependent methyltransferase [Halococcus morrhuae]EMA44512.1 O-methyltransferase-like protein [Halococcus morrhuae DSM 1307]